MRNVVSLGFSFGNVAACLFICSFCDLYFFNVKIKKKMMRVEFVCVFDSLQQQLVCLHGCTKQLAGF